MVGKVELGSGLWNKLKTNTGYKMIQQQGLFGRQTDMCCSNQLLEEFVGSTIEFTSDG